MEEKLEELRHEAVNDSLSSSADSPALEKDDWQLKQRGMNFISGIKSRVHSVIWRLKLDGVIYTVHVYQHDREMTITVYSFAPNDRFSSSVVMTVGNWDDRPFTHPLTDDLPGVLAVVKCDGHAWTLSVGGEDVSDWLSEQQDAPNNNEK